ncbi:sensor histidine kinase [Devosia submarina]|uniref:sensor histidine kinase n=1 Tax=Devosia submarina TaxID=1173082 RepID=UPI000D338195|nr:HAMP domain-containing sensor histidine kinase [Devosia submarina]
MSLGPYLSRRFLVAFTAVIILFVLLVGASVRLLMSEAEIKDDIAEDMVWLASQGQYEAIRFAEALSGFAVGTVNNSDLQLRFDLLVSRVLVLEQGEPHRQMQALGRDDDLDAYRATLGTVRERLPSLTPADAVDIANFRQAAAALAQSLRDVSNNALLAKREREALRRDTRRHTLFEILTIIVATMVAGLFLAGVVIRDQRNMANAEAALERERQISKLHRAFTSVVSHQFRTPLAIIDASAQRMIRRGYAMDYEEIAGRAEKIRNACLRLTRLMESTLNAARLEEGEVNFNPRPCNLRTLLHDICDNQSEEDQGRIELSFGDLPQWLEADTTLLEQAVQNLLSNALKYSPQSTKVKVMAHRSGQEIRINVTDQGVGIPADEMTSLFRRFYRARTAEGIPGTGIGLSFVSQIMAMHHGAVDVSSEEGKGSTFTLRFPYLETEMPRTVSPFAAPQATS